MNKEALDYWNRAVKTIHTAQELLKIEFDSAASRAYYAAFYSVSALLEPFIMNSYNRGDFQ